VEKLEDAYLEKNEKRQ